ncbi:MAG: lipid II flippase MurJ [Candidatus Syntrophopropionicum ammoniitolerans]
MPGIITISLATALVPAISDAISINKFHLVRSRCETAIRMTILAGIPFVVIFILLGNRICGYVFGYPEAGNILRILALGGPSFIYSKPPPASCTEWEKLSSPLKTFL